ncbi:hypothetical protein HDU96_010985 [Phlyctochytrium bullatum]|nr:hypothetical protein HDU96_010985 [Phlyctochytrium bullatum]
MTPSSIRHSIASIGVLLLSSLSHLPITHAQCIQDISALSSLITTSPSSLTSTSCEASCAFASYAFYGLQFTDHFSTTGMSGCSTYEGSTCFCAQSLSGGAVASSVGFDSFLQGYCGDCNTKLVCASSQNVDNGSPFGGRTCGLKYVYTLRDTTTVKTNSAFFYRVAVAAPGPTSSPQPVTQPANPVEPASSTKTNPPEVSPPPSVQSPPSVASSSLPPSIASETSSAISIVPSGTSSSSTSAATSQTASISMTSRTSQVSSPGTSASSTATPGSPSAATTNIQNDNKGLAGGQSSASTASTVGSGGGSSGVPQGLIIGLGVAGAVVAAAAAAFAVYRIRTATSRKETKGPLPLAPPPQPPAPPAPLLTQPFQIPHPALPISPTTLPTQPAFAPYQPYPPYPDPTSTATSSTLTLPSPSQPLLLPTPAAPLPTKHADALFSLPTAPLRTASLRVDGPVVAELDKSDDAEFLKSAGDGVVRMVFTERAGGVPMKTGGPAAWGWEEVRGWLERRGYGDCVERFKAADATGALLQLLYANPVLANEVLRTELGVAAVDQRLRFAEDLRGLFGDGEGGSGVGVGRGVTVEAPPPYVGAA